MQGSAEKREWEWRQNKQTGMMGWDGLKEACHAWSSDLSPARGGLDWTDGVSVWRCNEKVLTCSAPSHHQVKWPRHFVTGGDMPKRYIAASARESPRPTRLSAGQPVSAPTTGRRYSLWHPQRAAPAAVWRGGNARRPAIHDVR